MSDKIKISKLKLNPDNPREISEANFAKLTKSIKGFEKMMEKRPIVVDEDYKVLGGNMRLKALAELGYKEIPKTWISIAKGWTEAEKREFVIKDNNSFGQYNWDILSNDKWSDLPLVEWGVNIPDDWLGNGGEPIEEDEESVADAISKADELKEKWQTEYGQLWVLGNHKILCGDSTKREDVERLFGNEKAEMMLSSPPYNSEVGGLKSDYYGKKEKFYLDKKIDKKTKKEWIEFCDAVMNNFSLISKDKTTVLVWNVMYNANSRDSYGLQVFGKGHPFTVKETICWDKRGGFNISTKGILSRNWELVFILSEGEDYFTTQGENEARYAKWEINTNNTQIEGVHNAAFPVAFAEQSLGWFSEKEFIIYDAFLGSGTTLIASHNLNRRCFGMEISEAYTAVCLERFFNLTKIEPKLLNA